MYFLVKLQLFTNMIDTIAEFIEKYDETDKRFFYNNKISIDVMEYYLNSYENAKFSIICNSQTLTEDFIDKYKERIKWHSNGIYKSNLPETFYERYKGKINWHRVPYSEVSYDFILRNLENVRFERLVYIERSDINYEFYDINRKYFNLYEIASSYTHPIIDKLIENNKVIDNTDVLDAKYKESKDFLLKDKFTLSTLEYAMDKYDDINLGHMCEFQTLDEKFISKYIDRMDNVWYFIAKFQKISERFIEANIDKFDEYNLQTLSRYQKLSESFIEKHTDNVYWYFIPMYQNLSYNFLEKHMYKFNLYDTYITNKSENIVKLIETYRYKYEIDKLYCEFKNTERIR